MSFKISAKVVFLAFLAVLILLSFGLCYFVNQPKWISDTALHFLNKSSSEIVVKEITIEKIHWSSWDELALDNVRIKFKAKGVTYFSSIGNLHIQDLLALISAKPLLVDTKNVALVSDSLNISDLHLQSKVYFHWFHYERLESSFDIPRLEWNQYLIEGFKGHLEDQKNHLILSDAKGYFYGGDIELSGYLKYLKGLDYDFNLQLRNVRSALMAEVNPTFGQLTAIVDGTINLESSKDRGMWVKANLASPTGGSMKASLLRYLASYVPQRRQVEDLIRKDGDVSLSKIETRIISISSEKISSQVILNSSSLNLNMDVKFDINLEGGLGALLENIH